MPATRPTRGISLPKISGVIVVAAAVCAAWLLWSEFHDRGWIPGIAPPPEPPVNRLHMVEALVQRGRDGVPELVEAFADADPKARRLAILGLGRIGPEASEALEVVRRALTDGDAQTRLTAIGAFWQISQDAETTAPIVARMLADSDAGVCDTAAKALGTIRRPSIGPTIEMLNHNSAAVRSRALRVLSTLHTTDSAQEIDAAVRSRLSDAEPNIHDEALCLVVHWGQGTPAEIRELLHAKSIAFITDGSSSPVEMALYAISRLGPGAAELLPEIITLLDRLEILEVSSRTIERGNPLRKVPIMELHPRLQAILAALGSMKAQAKPATPSLMRRLAEIRTVNRIVVARTLVDMGAEANDLIPVLAPFLSAPGPTTEYVWEPFEVAHRAALVLVRASPEEARRQVSLLIPQLRSEATGVNKSVLYALWGLAPVASEAVPALIELVPHADGEVFWHAVVTLGEIGKASAPAVPVLVAQLEGNSQNIHAETLCRILEALGRIGPAANIALPILTKVINEPKAFLSADSRNDFEHWTTQFQLLSLASVGKICEPTPQVIAVLRAQLHRQPDSVRAAALKLLAALDGNSPEVFAECIGLLGDKSPTIRGQAALVIGSLESDRHEAVAGLVKNLADENPYVRTAAAIALGKIGPAAKEALPALREIERDPQGTLPLWKHVPAGWQRGMPGFEGISEIRDATIREAVQTAISEIERDRP